MIESVAHITKSKKFPPILLMFGEEDFLLEEAYHELLVAATNGNSNSFNCDIVDASEISAETLVEMASAFPMMSDVRVIVVKHFEKLVAGRANSKAEQKSPLTKYFTAPSPTTFLILLADAPDLNGLSAASSNPKQKSAAEKKLKAAKFPYNILLKECEWVEFPRLYDREIPTWVAKRFKTLKREITPDACELLIAQVGFSLRDLHNEIEKILIYVQDKTRITREDVINLIGANKTYNIFELQKAIGLKDLGKSIEIMQKMLSVDKQEILIITMLARYFTILWKLYEAKKTTNDNFELGRTVGISPFFVPEYIGALQKYPLPILEHAFIFLCEADLRLKTTSEQAETVLQKMLISIISNS